MPWKSGLAWRSAKKKFQAEVGCLTIVGDGVGVRRCSLDLACELPPEQITRVVCKTNLFDCVGLDPGVVLGNTSLVELSGQVVQFLGGLLAQSIDGVRT
jgi:hypothetical protein